MCVGSLLRLILRAWYALKFSASGVSRYESNLVVKAITMLVCSVVYMEYASLVCAKTERIFEQGAIKSFVNLTGGSYRKIVSRVHVQKTELTICFTICYIEE